MATLLKPLLVAFFSFQGESKMRTYTCDSWVRREKGLHMSTWVTKDRSTARYTTSNRIDVGCLQRLKEYLPTYISCVVPVCVIIFLDTGIWFVLMTSSALCKHVGYGGCKSSGNLSGYSRVRIWMSITYCRDYPRKIPGSVKLG